MPLILEGLEKSIEALNKSIAIIKSEKIDPKHVEIFRSGIIQN